MLIEPQQKKKTISENTSKKERKQTREGEKKRERERKGGIGKR